MFRYIALRNAALFIVSCAVGSMAAEIDSSPAGDIADAREVQPADDAPQPLTPAESAKRIRLPDGFRMDLVASEPLIQDPSCVAFDEFGRLLVCELHGYNVEGHLDVTELNKTGQLDKSVRRLRWELMDGPIAEQAKQLQFGVVKLLIDTDRDGVMDRAEVWADDLAPCYGVVPARGGIIVVAAPDIVYLADRDLDGKADFRETLFTGFKVSVLERGINNPQWGLDHWIYIGAGSHSGTITGPYLQKPVEIGNQDFRIRADGSSIEPVSGSVGTFGLAMNDIGDRFPCSGGQPAVCALPLTHQDLMRNPFVKTPSTNYSAANYATGYRLSHPHPWRVKREQDPAWVEFYGRRETNSNYFSGGCGGAIYRAEQFPKEYRGDLFYCEPSLNIIHRCELSRDGAKYVARRAPAEHKSEFLASTDQWFRPINLRVGPDGAFYVVDMYREIIEDYSAIPRHLQQQYGVIQGDDRGRIWRLSYKSDFSPKQVRHADLTNPQLARVLQSPNPWDRETAQRLLVERQATEIAAPLENLLDEPRYQTRLHALHTLHGLGQLRGKHVLTALNDVHFGVRLHAVQLAAEFQSDGQVRRKLASLVHDKDARVRLQLAATLGDLPPEEATAPLFALIKQHGGEPWMDAAVLSSARLVAADLLVRCIMASEVDSCARIIRPLATTFAASRDGQGNDKDELRHVLRHLGRSAAKAQTECLLGLIDGCKMSPNRRLKKMPESLAALLQSESYDVRSLAIRFAAALQLTDNPELTVIFEEAGRQAMDLERSIGDRIKSLRLLQGAPFSSLSDAAKPLLSANQPTELQLAAIELLAGSSDPKVADLLLDGWLGYSPQTRRRVLDEIFASENRVPALVKSIENRKLLPSEINPEQQTALLTNRRIEIASAAARLFKNQASSDELQKRIDFYSSQLNKPRNTKKGEQVFRQHCMNCHQLGDEGAQVGPSLGTVLNKPDEAILLELLDPNRRIDSEYTNYTIVTKRGTTHTGILVSESATSVTLRKEKGIEDSILRREIDLMQAARISLMPNNLHEQVSAKDAADLIAFLRKAFQTVKKPNR